MAKEDLKLQKQTLITLFDPFPKDSIIYHKSYKEQFFKANCYLIKSNNTLFNLIYMFNIVTYSIFLENCFLLLNICQ